MSITRLDDYRGKLLYLDTNVLIYAAEGFAIYATLLTEMLSRLESEEISGLTSEITIMETLVRPLRDRNSRMIAYYKEFLGTDSILRIVPIDRPILRLAAEIRAMQTLKPIDAIHVARAIISGCDLVVSDDRRLKSYPMLCVILGELVE